jgi:hypothetical protein
MSNTGYIKHELQHIRSRGSAVSIATGYGLDDRGVDVRVQVGSRILSSQCRLDWFWGPSIFYPAGIAGLGRA